jgi:hypothetical protein
MKKRYIAVFTTVFLAASVFAADLIVNVPTLQTNKSVVTTPTLLAPASTFAKVRSIYNSGTAAITVAPTGLTNLVANVVITNLLSGSLGVITVGSGSNLVFSENSEYGLLRCALWAQSSAATNAVIVLELK